MSDDSIFAVVIRLFLLALTHFKSLITARNKMYSINCIIPYNVYNYSII